MKKKKLLVVIAVITLIFAMAGCSNAKDEAQGAVDKVKDEAAVLIEDAENFLSAKKDLIGEEEQKLLSELKKAESFAITDVTKAEEFAVHLKDNVIASADALIAKAEGLNAEHPLLEEAKGEYQTILTNVKTSAEKLVVAIEGNEQEAFTTAKAEFDAAKEKLASFEASIKEKVKA